MSGTAEQADFRPWDRAAYQRVAHASGEDFSLEVGFEDGASATLDVRHLFSEEIPMPDWSTLEQGDFEVSFALGDRLVALPWLDMRSLSDPEFGAYLSERAASSANQVGLWLRVLRERRGFTAKEVADRAGLSPQSLSRIERGRHDVVFSTLQRLLGAMNYSLADLAEAQEPQVEMTTIRRSLKAAGLHASTVARILSGSEGTEQALARLRRVFNWTSTDLAGVGAPPVLAGGAALGTRFKLAKDRPAAPAYVAWAHHVAGIAEAAVERPTYRCPSDDPATFAAEVKSAQGAMDFEAVIRFVWERGIIVIPLADTGQFHGACWLINGTPVIALKQGLTLNSRWLFDLLHEILHVLRHLDTDQPAIVELGEIDYIDEDDDSYEKGEHEASAFAGQALLGDAEELAHEAIHEADRKIPWLKRAIPAVAERHGVDVGCLANYVAKRVDEEGLGDIWGMAMNFQKGQDQAPAIARALLLERIEWASLDDEDQAILRGALDEEVKAAP